MCARRGALSGFISHLPTLDRSDLPTACVLYVANFNLNFRLKESLKQYFHYHTHFNVLSWFKNIVFDNVKIDHRTWTSSRSSLPTHSSPSFSSSPSPTNSVSSLNPTSITSIKLSSLSSVSYPPSPKAVTRLQISTTIRISILLIRINRGGLRRVKYYGKLTPALAIACVVAQKVRPFFLPFRSIISIHSNDE